MKSQYRAGKLDGVSSWFRAEDGSLQRTAHYAAGVLEGEALEYDKGGWIAERSAYRNGVLEGELLRYTKSGKVRERIVYKNGKPQ